MEAAVEEPTSECSLVIGLADSFNYVVADHRLIDKSNKTSCCDFDGITCDGSNVIGLRWNNKDLGGSIPDYIGKISSLQTIDISGNSLTGEIPSLIGNLKNLTLLNLQNNRFSGKIPLSLGNLSNLKNLLVDGNHFSGDLTCSLLSTTLTNIKVENNKALLGKVWLHGNRSEAIEWGAYVPGTKVAICNEGGSVAFCQSKPKCDLKNQIYSGSSPEYKNGTSVSTLGKSFGSLTTDSNTIVIAVIASLGIAILIGLFGYMRWKSGSASFKQFDPEISSEKKDKVHRLSLFLAKKPATPRMESIS